MSKNNLPHDGNQPTIYDDILRVWARLIVASTTTQQLNNNLKSNNNNEDRNSPAALTA
jgi:hypothetical protein